jgi:hypothetical protein
MTQLIENKPSRRALIATLSHFHVLCHQRNGQLQAACTSGVYRRLQIAYNDEPADAGTIKRL